MALKLLAVSCLIAVVREGFVSANLVAAPAVAAPLVDATFDPNPQYSFAYDVQDALTGDSKSQVESRNGGVVQGQYTVADPDGTRRIVDYVADPINGFNAVVRKTPLAVAPSLAVAGPGPVPVARLASPLLPAPVAYAG